VLAGTGKRGLGRNTRAGRKAVDLEPSSPLSVGLVWAASVLV
jgi:hypothetical protein